jgi:hypothetical protein
MSTEAKKNPVPGETCIFYVNDSTAGAGVIIGTSTTDDRKTVVLILGWFTDDGASPNANVFGKQKMHPFPTYEEIMTMHVMNYDFADEIGYQQSRNRPWWESTGRIEAGCHSNLVARHFGHKNGAALLFLAATQHLRAGGAYDDFNSWDFFYEENFLQLWAELFSVLPALFPCPPEEWISPGISSRYKYTILPGPDGKLVVDRDWG